MTLVGILYLVFEDTLLAGTSSARKGVQQKNNITRTIVGVQIGLIVLATIVTRSSALSLQARLGLPRGNQIVGWLVLGKSLRLRPSGASSRLLTLSNSHFTRDAPGVSGPAKQPLPAQADGHLSYLRPDVCHFDHFL